MKRIEIRIADQRTSMQFLVDNGSHLKSYAANGIPIPIYGKKCIVIDLGLRRSLKWHFLVADITITILEVDFLKRHKFIVDLTNCKMCNVQTSRQSE